jgi:hypothetical protein
VKNFSGVITYAHAFDERADEGASALAGHCPPPAAEVRLNVRFCGTVWGRPTSGEDGRA